MKILITNDDGINSPVLPKLIAFAKSFGEVVCVAPKVEQSGKSHAIDFTRLIEIKRVDLVDGAECYSMDSTPADCVRYAVLGMKYVPDLVISGINRGFNLGKDIVYSGTIGAIFEAARLGITGVALSTDPKTFDPSVKALDRIADFFIANRLLERGRLYNVNIPRDDRGIRITRQGGIYFTDEFVHVGNGMYEQQGEMAKPDSTDLTHDTVALVAGYISVTPLTSEKTDLSLFNELLSLNS